LFFIGGDPEIRLEQEANNQNWSKDEDFTDGHGPM